MGKVKYNLFIFLNTSKVHLVHQAKMDKTVQMALLDRLDRLVTFHIEFQNTLFTNSCD